MFFRNWETQQELLIAPWLVYVPVTYNVYLRDGSPQKIVRTATQIKKLIKLVISPSPSALTLAQMAIYRLAPRRAATTAPLLSLVGYESTYENGVSFSSSAFPSYIYGVHHFG